MGKKKLGLPLLYTWRYEVAIDEYEYNIMGAG